MTSDSERPQLQTNPFRWNPSHWTRQRDWHAPENPNRSNCILVADDDQETELVYDKESGGVSTADQFFQAASQMSKGEILVEIEPGLTLEEARSQFLEILHRDIPEEEIEEGQKEVERFMQQIT